MRVKFRSWKPAELGLCSSVWCVDTKTESSGWTYWIKTSLSLKIANNSQLGMWSEVQNDVCFILYRWNANVVYLKRHTKSQLTGCVYVLTKVIVQYNITRCEARVCVWVWIGCFRIWMKLISNNCKQEIDVKITRNCLWHHCIFF